MQQIIFTISVLGLFLGSLGQPADNLEATFVGESNVCDGVFANVVAKDEFAQADGQAIVSAVVESFANALKSPEGAEAEAKSIGRKVLQVTATAEAKLDVTVNSPNKGCWAVGYGTAEARAIATAVVEAFAEGFSVALGGNVSSFAIARAQTKEKSVSEAVASVALLLFSGDGSGQQKRSAVAFAEAKAEAINCAFAEAFAAVYEDDTAVSEAIVQAGCPQQFDKVIGISGRGNTFSCVCKTQDDGVPVGCGGWGGADQICYVMDPNSCQCAQESTTYPGQKWRFCSSTLSTMHSWLTFQKDNLAQERYGFCPAFVNNP